MISDELCKSCKNYNPNSTYNCDINSSLKAFEVRNKVKAKIVECQFHESSSDVLYLENLLKTGKSMIVDHKILIEPHQNSWSIIFYLDSGKFGVKNLSSKDVNNVIKEYTGKSARQIIDEGINLYIG
jgi:hypothetical protein